MNDGELKLIVELPAPLALLGSVLQAIAGAEGVRSTLTFDDPEILTIIIQQIPVARKASV